MAISRAKLGVASISLWLMLMTSPVALPAEPLLSFASDEHAELFLQLTREYRCLKCQNQNLADSNAELAKDLRDEIYQQVIAGKTREQISSYLVARYGDFVLYRPPFKASTYALWLGPFVLLIIAFWYAIRYSRQNARSVQVVPESELQRARSALDE